MDKKMWIFGYGSLIWNPGFDVAETRLGRATGWSRSFCMRSIHHRGTETDPGLVLALDADPLAVCDGVLLRARAGQEAQTLSYLRERELVSSAYIERHIEVNTAEGTVEALAYVIDPQHNQYCQGLDLEDQAQIIAQAVGGRGPNRDYLWSTTQYLTQLGIEDPQLNWLSHRVRQLTV